MGEFDGDINGFLGFELGIFQDFSPNFLEFKQIFQYFKEKLETFKNFFLFF